MYRPLPDGLTIKNSPIEGLGLFATVNIKKNTAPLIIGALVVLTIGTLVKSYRPINNDNNDDDD